jgi:hypothetical protein
VHTVGKLSRKARHFALRDVVPEVFERNSVPRAMMGPSF